MNRHIYIIGAGGLGKEIAAYVKHINSDYYLMGFYDDQIADKEVASLPVFGNIDSLKELESGNNLFVGIGIPSVKVQAYEKIPKPERFKFPSFIQPNVYMGNKDQIKIGEGVCIGAGCTLTTDITLGNFVLLNLGVTVGHDVRVEDFSSIMPGANISGSVKIGKGVLIGSGATILQGLKVGDHAIVGAGAVVTKDVQPGTTVMGVPAQ